jgi:hypothetical protein
MTDQFMEDLEFLIESLMDTEWTADWDNATYDVVLDDHIKNVVSKLCYNLEDFKIELEKLKNDL